MLMVELGWDFITVVHSNDGQGRHSADVFRNRSERFHICINEQISVTSQSNLVNLDTRGVVYLGSEGVGRYAIRFVAICLFWKL